MNGNPQYTLQDQEIFNSGCSRHMTGNKSFLTNYQKIHGGFVIFGGSPKGVTTENQTNKNAEDAVAEDAGKKTNEKPANEAKLDNLLVQRKEGYATSTNRVSTVSPSVSAAGQSFDNADDLPTDPLMLDLEDTADLLNTSIFSGAYDDEDKGAEADLNNLETTMNVSPIPTTRIHKDHPKDQIIGHINLATQTRRMTKISEEHTLVEKALYGLHQAPRAWYETLSTYLLENRFRRGTIDKTLFIKKDKGDILLVQVKQKDDGIFISQDKYVADILKKFDFATVKTASTLIETNKALLKNKEAEDVDVHLYRSMIGSLMYLTASRPDIIYLKGQPKLGLWYPKDSPFDLEAFSDSDYAGASLDRKSTTGDLLLMWFEDGISDEFGVKTGSCKVNAARQDLVLLGEKGNADFHQIVDFLNASTIRYSLTISPTIYASYIEQFWATAKSKIVNNETQIHAKVDGKTIVISESSVRSNLHFNDEDGVTSLTNSEILENLALMGYEIVSDKLTFQKAFFSPQWKYLIHTILHCLSSKSTAWNEFSTNIASAVICLVGNEAVHKELGDRVERAATTAASLDAEQDSGKILKTQSTAIPIVPLSQEIGTGGGNTSGSDEETLEHQDDLMDFIPPIPHDSPLSRGHTP
ncbi:putative ribonuclease H-like domain-containing protein [Tanacetum coccineum]